MKALNRLIVAAMPLVPRPVVRRIAHRYVAGETLAHALETRFSVPAALVDERWTTEAASQTLRAAGRGGRAARVTRDATAAQIILQAWFDEPDER